MSWEWRLFNRRVRTVLHKEIMRKHVSTDHEKHTGRRRIAVAAHDLGFRATDLIRSVLALTFCIAGGLPVFGSPLPNR